MNERLIQTITSPDVSIRNRALASLLATMQPEEMLAECEALERFRRTSDNLYERVRACLFLFAAYRFGLQEAQIGRAHV